MIYSYIISICLGAVAVRLYIRKEYAHAMLAVIAYVSFLMCLYKIVG